MSGPLSSSHSQKEGVPMTRRNFKIIPNILQSSFLKAFILNTLTSTCYYSWQESNYWQSQWIESECKRLVTTLGQGKERIASNYSWSMCGKTSVFLLSLSPIHPPLPLPSHCLCAVPDHSPTHCPTWHHSNKSTIIYHFSLTFKFSAVLSSSWSLSVAFFLSVSQSVLK